MATKKTMSFEDAVQKLEAASQQLKSGKLSLEESSKLYEESIKYYELANCILKEAKQKIEIYRPETGKTEDFED